MPYGNKRIHKQTLFMNIFLISTPVFKRRKAAKCCFSFYRRPRYSMDQEVIMTSRKPHPKEFEIGLTED
ncbi:hypothetical protein IW15_19760 [Chryseobacterium soli]|uniref:Uncharacterized protein n=1 Tax=Chryseobacterium soli TaxID=445961 RepID=A0A086A1L0_9FLAO|nr:hypothetical protein IW15_19760 [Chryseobacterium soli]